MKPSGRGEFIKGMSFFWQLLEQVLLGLLLWFVGNAMAGNFPLPD
jgi:hypothetical protein